MNYNSSRRIKFAALAFSTATCVLAFAASSPANAQKAVKPAPPVVKTDAKLPTAQAVLDKYVEVTGGKAAYDKITSTSTKATMALTAQGLSGTVEAYAKAPNKIYVAQTFDAIGKAEQGYDGTTAWASDPLSGLRTLEGTELDGFKNEATFNAPANWRTAYAKTEMVGLKSVAGQPAYAVRVTGKNGGKTSVQYFDTKTGLQVKSESTQETPQGKFPVETFYSDYRAVDGVKVPFKIRAVIAGNQELVSTVTEYKNNVVVDDKQFAKPAKQEAPVTPPVTPTVAPAAPATP